MYVYNVHERITLLWLEPSHLPSSPCDPDPVLLLHHSKRTWLLGGKVSESSQTPAARLLDPSVGAALASSQTDLWMDLAAQEPGSQLDSHACTARAAGSIPRRLQARRAHSSCPVLVGVRNTADLLQAPWNLLPRSLQPPGNTRSAGRILGPGLLQDGRLPRFFFRPNTRGRFMVRCAPAHCWNHSIRASSC